MHILIHIIVSILLHCIYCEGIFAQQSELEFSNLPIFIIDTDGATIPDEPKIDANLGVIWNQDGSPNYVDDNPDHYDGLIGIELRGNSTQHIFPKKPYAFETRDENGENNNVELLGMPSENDWILRAAYMDKTLIRDALSLWMARAMGNYASRTAHVELILNDSYEGVYILEEKIKPDQNRVNIEKMDQNDNEGDELTGGYIYEVANGQVPAEETLSGLEGDNRRLKYPKPDDITNQQHDYIRDYDDDFRALVLSPFFDNPIFGYSSLIDVNSFIDEILIQEVTKNSDAYGWSSYFHKDRSSLLRAGPAWDFDQSLSNSTWNYGSDYTLWVIEGTDEPVWGGNYPPFWLPLFEDPNFTAQLCQRWFELRGTVWSTDSLMGVIDSLTTLLDEPQGRNFERWPILGVEIWRSLPGWENRDTYELEVAYLSTFLFNRLEWMDAELGVASGVSFPVHGTPLSEGELAIHPNPSFQHTRLKYDIPITGELNFEIFNIKGQLMRKFHLSSNRTGSGELFWDGRDTIGNLVPKGIYFVSIQTGSQVITTKLTII